MIATRLRISGAAFAAFALATASVACAAPGPCALLSPSQIAHITGLHVPAAGQQGAPMAGAQANCRWRADDGTEIIVVLADASHMQVTMQSQEQAGADAIPGVGLTAVGTQGNDETEGGYNMSVLDAKGGVAVSILGAQGTQERTIALAKTIEAERSR